ALSLVSGRPISFVSQLYAPKYVARPEAELADDTAARPVVHTGAFEDMRDQKAGVGGGGGNRPAVPNRLEQFAAMQAPPPPPARLEVAPSSIVADAIGRELGDLFEYRIA